MSEEEKEFTIGNHSYSKKQKVFARWTDDDGTLKADHWFYPAFIDGIKENGFVVKWAERSPTGPVELSKSPILPEDIIDAQLVLREGSCLNVIDPDDIDFYIEVRVLEPRNHSAQYLVEILQANPPCRIRRRFTHFALNEKQTARFFSGEHKTVVGPEEQCSARQTAPVSVVKQRIQISSQPLKKPVLSSAKPKPVKRFQRVDDEDTRLEPVDLKMETVASHWLVRVPQELADRWKSFKSEEVGQISIDREGDSDELSAVYMSSVKDGKGPTEYSLTAKVIKSYAFIKMTNVLEEDSLITTDLALQRVDMRPIGGGPVFRKAAKEKQKVELIEFDPMPSRVQFLGKKHSPVGQHGRSVRKYREDRETIKNQIMDAFEAHQYCRTNDLEKLTEQPRNYLTEILDEIAKYDTVRFRWELKPEYCHYR